MIEINIKKQELRKDYITIRNNIKNKKEKSIIISDKVKKDIDYQKAKVVALYKSLLSEVNTDELIKYSINSGKIVALPKVINNELIFYKINIEEVLVKSNFGVEEPTGNEENFINKNNIDLLIIPGICFDKQKNRLGFGKGYYDRFLNNTSLKTIALCFNEQILNNQLLPITDHDKKVNKIITDDKTYL